MRFIDVSYVGWICCLWFALFIDCYVMTVGVTITVFIYELF